MSRAVVLSAVRTPIGRYGGALAEVRPDDLAAVAIAAAVERAGVDAGSIDDVYFGCANQAGEDNRNVARMAALLAGLPDSVRRCDAQPPLRVRPLGRRLGVPRDRRRRRGVRRRGRRRVDEPRAARHGEARDGLSARQPDGVGHDARLALPEPAARGDVPARVDGGDGRERRRALRRLARGAGRVRAPLAAPLVRCACGGSLRRRARPGRRRRRGRASAPGHARPRRSRG